MFEVDIESKELAPVTLLLTDKLDIDLSEIEDIEVDSVDPESLSLASVDTSGEFRMSTVPVAREVLEDSLPNFSALSSDTCVSVLCSLQLLVLSDMLPEGFPSVSRDVDNIIC
mmetsp:Transcript_9842/g.11341  ORF Transcript_9842/g.11341 Transcript_9842/m.11341 type:complete len:113 (+) Transcript_9842:931-1269(+)